ncbi:hypothetical protein LTS10_008711 [Elasticomyces elasticus]|nr:hypothetical protein LTS10_008711 [Elasticomyces elasticus]
MLVNAFPVDHLSTGSELEYTSLAKTGAHRLHAAGYNPERGLTTVQLFCCNLSSPQQLAEALSAAQRYLDEATILGLGQHFPKMRCVTIFDCLNFDLSWSLDHKLSVAGQKGLPSWKSVQPGLAILQLIAQSPSILDRDEETRCHVLYMLNFSGYENSIDHYCELLDNMVSQKSTTNFCTLDELKAALKGGKKNKTLKLLMERMAKRVVSRNEANIRRSTSAAARSLRDLTTNILLKFACDTTRCTPEEDDMPVVSAGSFGDDEDEDSNVALMKHVGLFWSYSVWAKIKNKRD